MSNRPNIKRYIIVQGNAAPHPSFARMKTRQDFLAHVGDQVAKLAHMEAQIMRDQSVRALASLKEPTQYVLRIGGGRTETVMVQRTWKDGDLPLSVLITQANCSVVNVAIEHAARILEVMA